MNYFLVASLWLASLTASPALLLSFDAAPLTSGTGDPLSSSFTIDFAYLETVDGNGDALANPSWTIDGTAGAVAAGSPTAAGWGASSSDALDGRDQPLLFTFAVPVNLDGFSARLDDSVFGNLGAEEIRFYDEADGLLGAISLSQSTPGYVAASGVSLVGVKKMLLPTAAFYDDVLLVPGAASVPEPGSSCLAGAAVGGLLLRRRRSGA